MGNSILVPLVLTGEKPYGFDGYKGLPSVIPRYVRLEGGGLKKLNGIYTRVDLLSKDYNMKRIEELLATEPASVANPVNRNCEYQAVKQEDRFDFEQIGPSSCYVNPESHVLLWRHQINQQWFICNPVEGFFYYSNSAKRQIPPLQNWKMLAQGQRPVPHLSHIL